MGRKSMAEQRRIEILDAFYHCVVDHGFAGSSLRKIAARAGMQTSVLHHYFSGRDEMIQELVHHYTTGLFDDFLAGSARVADPEERLAMGLEFIFSPEMINAESNGFFMACCAEAGNNPRVRNSITRLFQRFRGAILDQLLELPRLKPLPRSRLETLAALVVAAHEGMELQWFADPHAVDLDQAVVLVKEWIFSLGEKKAP